MQKIHYTTPKGTKLVLNLSFKKDGSPSLHMDTRNGIKVLNRRVKAPKEETRGKLFYVWVENDELQAMCFVIPDEIYAEVAKRQERRLEKFKERG